MYSSIFHTFHATTRPNFPQRVGLQLFESVEVTQPRIALDQRYEDLWPELLGEAP